MRKYNIYIFAQFLIYMKKYLSIIILLLLVSSGYAETESASPKGKIKGVVSSKTNKEALEYATVALYEANTNKLISGDITDFLGHFKLDKPDKGSYYVSITFIGLKDIKSDVFEVDESNDNINLGNFFLESGSKDLGEVEVVAKRASIEYRIDKKVINVDKQITAEAGNAVDILENVPSVQVDIEGNVSLRGSSSFSVLIDGKPTILEPSDALRQISSSNIENIEIITNPSVKYEPDGAAGIINIVTKKNFIDGLSGIVNLNAGTYGQYGGDFQLNYRVNKFNFIMGASYNNRRRPGDIISERESTSGDTTYFVNSSGTTEREYHRSSFKAGFEYNPSKNDFFSLSGRYGNWAMNNGSDLLYEDFTLPETEFLKYNSMDQTTRGGDYFAVDAIYQHTFRNKIENKPKGEKGMGNKKANGGGGPLAGQMNTHNIKFQVNYRNRVSDETTINDLLDLDNNIIGGQKNVENGPSESVRINIDYTLPLKNKNKFEAGLQGRIGESNDNTELWLFNEQTGQIEFIPEFSNQTNYKRNIYAAYSLYAGEAGKFGYQVGLRTEYTDRKISMKEVNDFKLNRWDFFPTLHISYNLPKDQQLMVSYTRRIQRPRGWQLEPFITWQDSYNVRRGNPDLKPEYIDSFDAGYLIKFAENFVSLEGYYRITNNKIERINSVYSENVMLRSFENVGKDYSLGIEAMFNMEVTPWWELSLSGNLYNYKIEGVLNENDFSRKSTNWSSRFNNTFSLLKNLQFQLSSRYNSKTVTAQGSSSGFYTVDAALKMSFLKRSLTANIQGRDIFGTALRESSSSGQGFNTYYKFTPFSPMFNLTVSYKFNNFKMKRGNSEGAGDEEF